MAKSTEISKKRVWVGFLHPVNKTLIVQGFSDTLSKDGDDSAWQVERSAEQDANTFLSSNHSAIMLDGAVSAENAIEMAKTIFSIKG